MRQLRQPRLAEIIATKLREDILSGRLKEGDVLGNQDALLAQYQVSPPALREAMRILETDGLITVRRGNVGGAVIHVPTPQRAAEMIAMVLQTRGTTPRDVSDALRYIEPICASLCAERADRNEAVVPVLREIVEKQRVAFEENEEYLRYSGEFHRTVVEQCGNEPMIVVIGALQAIWSSHASMVWGTVAEGIDAPLPAGAKEHLEQPTKEAALRTHSRLVDAIEAGDSAKASDLARAHLEASHRNTLSTSEHDVIVARLVGGE